MADSRGVEPGRPVTARARREWRVGVRSWKRSLQRLFETLDDIMKMHEGPASQVRHHRHLRAASLRSGIRACRRRAHDFARDERVAHIVWMKAVG